MVYGSEVSVFVDKSTPSLGRSLTSVRWGTVGIPSVITVGVHRHPVQSVGLYVSARRFIVDLELCMTPVHATFL